MHFWYNGNPNSPWMNRCGLTSGKKSPVTAQNQTMKFQKIKKSSGEASWTQELSLRCFQDKPSKIIIILKKSPSKKIGGACHRQAELFICLSPSFWPLFFCGFSGAPETVLFHPKLGSDCSGAPSSLRLPTPPHNN